MDSFSLEGLAKVALVGFLFCIWLFGGFCGFMLASIIEFSKVCFF